MPEETMERPSAKGIDVTKDGLQETEEAPKPKRKPRGVSMNRSSQCGKFVSMEPGEPEEQGLTLEV